MLARSMAWQFLKKQGVKRPKHVIYNENSSTAKIDIQEFTKKRETPTKMQNLSQSYR